MSSTELNCLWHDSYVYSYVECIQNTCMATLYAYNHHIYRIAMQTRITIDSQLHSYTYM